MAKHDFPPFEAGETVRFEGTSVNGNHTGSFPVKVVNPHSNAHKVTNTDKRGRMYEGAYNHIPTATVEKAARKSPYGDVKAAQFEAYHHHLRSE